jgi:alpha-glucosidase
MNASHPWWQKGIIYQIYPRSFQDSNGDGIGDLPGILQRLDYVKRLNVDAVWISPIYPSPMADFGYDVADYTGIHPMFGSMADFDRLLDAAHARGLRIILDLVPNHTSHEHPWFIESRSSRDNPKRDWYIWRDPKPDGSPPNNWLSAFGGPAWTLDERTGQYYLHQFCPEQPELNYRNPEVLDAMLDVMRFWLDKGVDGFRIDVITLMIKDEALRDNPPNPNWQPGDYPSARLLPVYSRNQPEVHDVIREMRAVIDAYDDRVMIGETYFPNEMLDYYGEELDECHLPFNFDLIRTPWDATKVRASVDRYEADLPAGAWPNYVLGNHDQHRLATRAGQAQARVANMLLLTLRGTPTCYYGDEIGMHDVKIPPDKIQDPPAVNNPESADTIGRDPERTPMQWNAAAHAGFCPADVEPWLPVADDYTKRNVAAQEKDPTSMLHLFRALTALRRAEPALAVGDYAAVDVESGEVFAYTRTAPDTDRFLIVLNFGNQPHTLDLSAVAPRAEIALATDRVRSGAVALAQLTLAPNEGLILRCEEPATA